MKDFTLDDYIDKQAAISAIDRFTQKHDMVRFDPSQKKYRELIPQKDPDKGQQYAFEVDLDKCTGCKACVVACHSENGLDEEEAWRSVGLIQGGSVSNPAIQHVTSACHHCLEPACMNGCPTMAYTKDPHTGIVKHLDDQCFGCQYCILKCPYDVPKYSKAKGIVHKCDMCIDRLKDKQAPACARACPNGAINITIVDTQEVRKNPAEFVKIPDAPASDYTFPTTKYITKKRFPSNMASVDYFTLKPEHSHMPLVIMLVLTQLSVGAFLALALIKTYLYPQYLQTFRFIHLPLALSIGLCALAASIFHLGRPHLAFRAFLGVRTSWLSREIIAFGGFAKLAIIYAVAIFLPGIEKFLVGTFGRHVLDIVMWLVVACGMAGILCSVMVYRDTRRPFWDNHSTTAKFLLSSVILGAGLTLLTSMVFGALHPDVSFSYLRDNFGFPLGKIICAASIVKMLIEASVFLVNDDGHFSFIRKSAMLMARQLMVSTLWRFGCGITGGVLLPALFMGLGDASKTGVYVVFSFMILVLLLAGELLERYLFFKAVVPLKMPGGISID